MALVSSRSGLGYKESTGPLKTSNFILILNPMCWRAEPKQQTYFTVNYLLTAENVYSMKTHSITHYHEGPHNKADR